MRKDVAPADYHPEEIARRRDATIKAMLATPPKPHKDVLKKRAKAKRRGLQKA